MISDPPLSSSPLIVLCSSTFRLPKPPPLSPSSVLRSVTSHFNLPVSLPPSLSRHFSFSATSSSLPASISPPFLSLLLPYPQTSTSIPLIGSRRHTPRSTTNRPLSHQTNRPTPEAIRSPNKSFFPPRTKCQDSLVILPPQTLLDPAQPSKAKVAGKVPLRK